MFSTSFATLVLIGLAMLSMVGTMLFFEYYTLKGILPRMRWMAIGFGMTFGCLSMNIFVQSYPAPRGTKILKVSMVDGIAVTTNEKRVLNLRQDVNLKAGDEVILTYIKPNTPYFFGLLNHRYMMVDINLPE